MYQNNDTATMLVSHTNPVGIEPFSYVKISLIPINLHRSWPRNVTAAILVSRKNKTAAMFVSQTNPLGVELFFPYT